MMIISLADFNESIVSNETDKGTLEVEGYISNENEIPCYGHLGFFAVYRGTVSYSDLVEKAVELGMSLGEGGLSAENCHWEDLRYRGWGNYIPQPRSGTKAFAFAVKDLEYRVGYVEDDAWRDERGRKRVEISYEIVKVKGRTQYKLVRRYRGFNIERQEWDSVTEDLFRVNYVPPTKDHPLRTWSLRHEAQLWGRSVEIADPEELSDLVEVVPYDANVVVDANLLNRVTSKLCRAMRRECTTIDQDGLRRVIRNAIQLHQGVQFGGSSGGVYYIPDRNSNQDYLESLVPFSELINWFGEMNKTEREDLSQRFNTEGTRIDYYQPQTSFRLLGYVDSPRQMEYLRQDVAREIGSHVTNYYDDILKMVRETDDENLSEAINALVAKKDELSERLGTMKGIVGDATSPPPIMADVYGGIETRLASLTTTHEKQANRIRGLLQLDF